MDGTLSVIFTRNYTPVSRPVEENYEMSINFHWHIVNIWFLFIYNVVPRSYLVKFHFFLCTCRYYISLALSVI